MVKGEITVTTTEELRAAARLMGFGPGGIGKMRVTCLCQFEAADRTRDAVFTIEVWPKNYRLRARTDNKEPLDGLDPKVVELWACIDGEMTWVRPRGPWSATLSR